jgi:hypothetical protein
VVSTLQLACERLRHLRPGVASATADLDAAVAGVARDIERRWPELGRADWIPGGRSCAIVLTHDVDNVNRWTNQHVAHLARHVPERMGFEGMRAIARLPYAAVRRLWEHPDIAARIRACVRLEQQFDARGTFLFFSPDARHRRAFDGWYTADTQFEGHPLHDFWHELQTDGFDVGLHLSIGAHDHPTKIAHEWAGMRSVAPNAVSCRNHYLKESPGVTFAALSASGVHVDLTLTMTGFAYGTGLPFRPSPASAYRLPTVIQDQPIPVDGASRKLRDDEWSTWERILNETARNHSVATVLLHPGKTDSPEMLERLLRWGADHGAWMGSAAAFISAWQARTARSLPATAAAN